MGKRRPGATFVGILGVAMGSVLLLCGAGLTPTGNVQRSDINASGYSITNAYNLVATNSVQTPLLEVGTSSVTTLGPLASETPGAGVAAAASLAVNTAGGLVEIGTGGYIPASVVPTLNQPTTAQAGSVVGLTIATGKTVAISNSMTLLAGTDAETLNIGAGGTLGTGAFASAYVLPNATSSTLGGVVVGTGLTATGGTLSINYGTASGTALQGNYLSASVLLAGTNAVNGPNGLHAFNSDGSTSFPYGVTSVGGSSGMASSTNGNFVFNFDGDTAGYTAPNSDTEFTVVNWNASNTNSGAEIGCAVMTVQAWYQTATWSASANALTLTGTGAGTSASITGVVAGQGVATNGVWDGAVVASVSGTTVTLTPPSGQTYSTFAANSGTGDVVCFFDRNTTASCSWTGSSATSITVGSANTAIAVGDIVTGTNIPAGDTVATVTSSTAFTLTTATTGTGSGTTLTFTPPAFYATNGGGPTPPGGGTITYNGPVGSQFAAVPLNRPASLIPGTGQFVFNSNNYDMRQFEISAPGASGLDPGNYSFLVTDFQNQLFRIPYWQQYSYQPSDPGWLDAFSVSPLTGLVKIYRHLLIGNTAVDGGTATPYLDIEAQGPRTELHNTNDTLAFEQIDTNNSWQVGVYNPTGSTSGGITAGTLQSYFGCNSSGEVGSLSNSVTGYGGDAPTFVNILDDGTTAHNLILPYTISTANNQLLLSAWPGGGVDNSCSIIVRHNGYNVNDYYVYGGNASSGYGHQFWTGGAQGSQTKKFGVYNDYTVVTNEPLAVDTAGYGLQVKEGSNAKQGAATLVAGTVTVSNTSVTANSRIFLTAQSLGTVSTPQALAVTARSAGTSFTITSASSSDTSVVAWEIFEPAP